MKPTLEFWLRCLVCPPAPTAPAALDSPSPPQRPAPYESLHGWRVGYLCLAPASYAGLPWQQEFPNQSVLLVEDHLHVRGDSQNTPKDDPQRAVRTGLEILAAM